MTLKLLITGLLALLLGACAQAPTTTPAGSSAIAVTNIDKAQQSNAEEAQKHADIAKAAMAYLQRSSTAEPPKRQLLKMQAIELYLQINQLDQARTLLSDIDITPLTAEQRNAYLTLQIELALRTREPERALQWLQRYQLDSGTSVEQRKNYYQFRIRAYELQGEPLAATRERSQLDALLAPGEEKTLNQQKIILTLTSMPEKTLLDLSTSESNRIFFGWIDLSLLVMKTPDPNRLANMLNVWKRGHLSHPVSENTLALLAPRKPADNQPPSLEQIALLLPLDGPFKDAAQAVRDSFISAYYSRAELRHNSQIRVYNTAAPNSKITDVYRQAVDDGASIVVGPLRKEEVDALVADNNFTVPTLALNTVDDSNFFRENFYQFGLSPEDEARQVANRAWADGHNLAAVIYPKGVWGERVAQSFSQRWQELGGKLVATQTYDGKQTDFSDSITAMLDLDDSRTRNNKLRNTLGEKLDFEPRRREDIDLIFMAAFPRQARLIPPQLKFHHGGDIPVYSTSHVYTGKPNRNDDRDLNDVMFTDMPWTLPGSNRAALYDTLQKTWPTELAQNSRLYALGVDAYNVLYYLNWLRTNPNATLNAATGTLSINNKNQVRRSLVWARFNNGWPELISDAPVMHR
ncbi:MAG: penicillin-binding protein activator [Gammaproteobacteria bacterium]|nr:penicillin-binding protein activator [Gammaproteobacteria bacterium]